LQQIYTGQTYFLSLNQQCQSTDETQCTAANHEKSHTARS